MVTAVHDFVRRRTGRVKTAVLSRCRDVALLRGLADVRHLQYVVHRWASRPLTTVGILWGTAIVLLIMSGVEILRVLTRDAGLALQVPEMIERIVSIGDMPSGHRIPRAVGACVAIGALVVGAVVLSGARAGHRLAKERTGSWLHALRWVRSWPGRLVFVTGFVATVAVLTRIDIFWANYDATGPVMLAYSVGRLLLAGYMVALSVTAGALLVGAVARGRGWELASVAEQAIISFFVGASAYGLAGVMLAQIGYLVLPAALALTVPVLLWAPAVLAALARRACIPIASSQERPRQRLSRLPPLLAWLVLVIAAVLVISRGIYPGAADGDVWEHYLPYYRDVLSTASAGPNEIWYHFYVSKGAGLVHLAGVMSDALAAQLVSLGFVALMAAIVADLIWRLTDDRGWSWLGVAMFLGYAAVDISAGAFFKHHMLFAGYFAFFTWSAFTMLQQYALSRALAFATAFCAFYIGLSQPVTSIVTMLFFSTMLIMGYTFPSLEVTRRWGRLALTAQVAGIVLVLTFNISITGLAEMMPLRVFWAVADRLRFDQTFGPSGALFFLVNNNDLHAHLDTSGKWLAKVFRFKFFDWIGVSWIMASAVVAGTAALLDPRESNKPGSIHRTLLVITIAALLPSALFAQVVQVDSVVRLYIFTGVPLIVIAVVLMRAAVIVIVPQEMLRAVAVLVMLLVATVTTARAVEHSLSRLGSGLAFASGARSAGQALMTASEQMKDADQLAFFIEARQRIGPNPRILTLTYSPGPQYSFPGGGLVSEPSYTLGPEYQEIVFGRPDRAKALLAEREMNYFHLDLRQRLFSGVAFSRLFSAESVSRYVRVIASVGDNYLLTWRENTDSDEDKVPTRLLRVLELKQRAAIWEPFTEEFAAALAVEAATAIEQEPRLSSIESDDVFVRAVAITLAGRMNRRVSMRENRGFIVRLVAETEPDIRSLAAAAFRKMAKSGSARRQQIWHQLIQDTVRRVREMLIELSEEEFGVDIGRSLVQGIDRVPFGVMYDSREATAAILASHTLRK